MLFSACLLLLGTALFAWQQDWLGNVSLGKLIWPVLLIIVGILVIASAFTKGHSHSVTNVVVVAEDGSLPKYEVSFGELCPDYNGQPFSGCCVDASFGKVTLDLRQAVIEKDCTIQMDVAFAGAELMLPPGCRLNIRPSPVIGGIGNSCPVEERLVVNRFSAMSISAG